MRRLVRGILACRYVILVAVTVVVYLHTLAKLGIYSGGDWYLFVIDADVWASPHPFHAMAAAKTLPTAPFTVVVCAWLRHLGSRNGWQGTCFLMFALAPLLILIIERAARRTRTADARLHSSLLVGGCLLILAWAGAAGTFGHPDDVFALVALAVAAYGCAGDRWVVAAVGIGVAAAFKPWGFYFLPLAAVADPRRVRGIGVALAIGVLPWVPFVAVDRHSLDAGHFVVPVMRDSSLRLFGIGVHQHVTWVRLLQPALICGLGAIAVLRRRWQLLLWLGFAVRINLEPGAFAYYGVGPVVGALIADLLLPPGRVPAYRTVATWVLMYGVGDVADLFGASSAALDGIKIVARVALLALAASEMLRPTRESATTIESRETAAE